MQQRLEKARENLYIARDRWAIGEVADSFDTSDTAAWYILQGETFATDRRVWVPEEAARIIPFLTRLGRELDSLKKIPGTEIRAERLMTNEKRQPQSGIYELLVALAYKRRGWTTVEFVPEEPGVRRTPDILVSKPRSRWAVECKRLMPSPYSLKERDRGRALAAPVHALSLEMGRSLVTEVIYKCELMDVPDDHLLNLVRESLSGKQNTSWENSFSLGRIRDVDWSLCRRILSKDDVYFGSSRMIELVTGAYSHDAEYSFSAKWRPSPKRSFYAEAVYQANVVKWWSGSFETTRKKSRHFRSILANAEGQLPSDCPGVIHIGLEVNANNDVEFLRHLNNLNESRNFTNNKSRLRWVYGNYFVPEVTTHEKESWAIVETMIPYRVGVHNTKWPLPGHMLISPEDEARAGVHWDGQSE